MEQKSENAATVVVNTETVEAQEKASYDIQIATAKKYPRVVMNCLNNALAIATMDKATAESCGYALPRGATKVSGPSVHLARILIQTWGNVRVESKVIDITRNQIVSQAVCFDLESNVATKVEVRRSIVGNRGRFNDDMITVTGNACNAIAYRNAVFATIPASVVDKVYNETLNVITGNINNNDDSGDAKLIDLRNQWVEYFKKKFNTTDDELLFCTGKKSINAIGRPEIAILSGINQAITDGDTSIDEAFDRNNKTVSDKKKDLKDKPKVDLP